MSVKPAFMLPAMIFWRRRLTSKNGTIRWTPTAPCLTTIKIIARPRHEANPPHDLNEWINVAANPKKRKAIRELARWLPGKSLPLAPGSAERILQKMNGVWFWEAKPINPKIDLAKESEGKYPNND